MDSTLARPLKILLFVGAPSHFREMAALAELLSGERRFQVKLVMLSMYQGASESLSALPHQSVSWVDGTNLGRAVEVPTSIGHSALPQPFYSNQYRRGGLLRAVILFAFQLFWHRYPSLVRGYLSTAHAYIRNLDVFLRNEQADLIVLPEENLLAHSQIFVRAIHQCGGKALIFPFTVADHREWAEAFGRDPGFRPGRLKRALIRRAFPSWMILYKGKWLAFPLPYILLNEWLGTAPPKPWLLNSGHADKIVLESRFLLDYGLRAGLPKEKMVVLGAAYLDRIYESEQLAAGRKRDLLRDFNAHPRQRFVLLCLPPDQFVAHHGEWEFANYPDLTDYLIGFLSAIPEVTVLVSPHPRIPEGDLERLSRAGANILRGPIFELMPLCDLFVACASATIRMAVAASKPVVNFDCYRLGYEDFSGIPGVFSAATREDFEARARTLLASTEVLGKATREVSDYSRANYEIDGNAGDRIISFILSGEY